MTEAEYQLPMRRNPKTGKKYFVLEGVNKELFAKLYPVTSHPDLSRIFGVCLNVIRKFGKELGLAKDLREINRKSAIKAVATCTENGYYASLRGKRPSEKCIQLVRERFASGFNPIKVFKERHTEEEYRALIQRGAQTKKRVIKADRLRIRYGLPQRTKYRLPDEAEKRAHMVKLDMIYRCNYFADPAHPNWVCYDKDTKRSAVREATAIRRGLEIVEGE